MLSWDESSIYHTERKVTAVRFSKWHIAPEKPEAQACLRAAGYPYLVAAVLSARGIETPEQAAAFLEREDKLTISPFLMRDMDKAAARVQRAIAGGERIAVFGDYDVDGITATCILVDYLKSRGADVVHYIPRRIEDGYGLSRDAIKGLFDQGVRLLVTVDCGITGVEEVDYANSLGLDVVITDHHECREVLPRAVAVVDPHRADCGYPFKHLAGCGVALKLVLALGGPDREEPLFARYCTLAAIGTVADVMQMSGENRTIVSRGLATLEHSDFIGLHALLREARRALPTREQFAAAWRFLDRTVPEDGLTTDRLPLLRLMAAELGGAEPVLRAAMCAAVFRERGLLDWQLNGDAITLHLRRGQHVALDQSPLMNTLQNDNEKGGGAL